MDKAQFEKRFSKVSSFNRGRFAIARQIMTKNVNVVLDLVPILIHYNHPAIPGYRKNGVPFGIDMFTPNDFQRKYLQDRGIDPDEKTETFWPVYALYAMGSTSSIAQGQKSDLDIWVCVSKDLPHFEMNLLAEKCRFISSFCKALGADVNLFVTAENRFISGEHGTMDTEDCGSAQSLFLLDEFYRSSFRICGRYIVWYMIPVEDELRDYASVVEDFYKLDWLIKDQWFDFGSVAKCSPVEYFGSGMWLVYKGIDHPLKALLKIILMEAYASEYPHTILMSMDLKSSVISSRTFGLGHDSYYILYKKVSKYLSKIGDKDRLELVRKCFYLKLLEAIDGQPQSKLLNKRKILMRRVAKLWDWSSTYIEKLSSKKNLNLSSIKHFQNQLLESLLKSYKALLRFSVTHGIEYAITSDDAGVLSRKIYASIDRYPGKIMQSYSEVSNFMEEETLSLILPSENTVCRHGWHVYPCAIDNIDLLSTRVVYIAPRAVEMVAWLTANRVLTSRTKVYVSARSSSVDYKKIKRLTDDIDRFFFSKKIKVREDDLRKARDVVKSMVVINFENDITKKFLISNSDLELGDSLSCGRQKMCLIGSIDVISLNTWGELTCHSYSDGELGVVELLATILRSSALTDIPRENIDLEKILKVCSYSDEHGDLIRYDLESTIKGILGCYSDYESTYVFNVSHNTYEARVNEDSNDVSIIRRSMFRASDDDVTILSRFGMRPEYALQVPASVEHHATIGIMQYFFAREQEGWKIYIVNERNEVKIFYGFNGSRAALVNSINRYYTAQSDSSSAKSTLNFNLPQYFVLGNDQKSIHPFTISNK